MTVEVQIPRLSVSVSTVNPTVEISEFSVGGQTTYIEVYPFEWNNVSPRILASLSGTIVQCDVSVEFPIDATITVMFGETELARIDGSDPGLYSFEQLVTTSGELKLILDRTGENRNGTGHIVIFYRKD